MTEHALHLGTAGWSYPDWVGPFYPDGTRRDAMFAKYVQRFSAVELDSSFYGIPRKSSVESWAERSPEGFLICPKFPKAVSHDSFLEDCRETHAQFIEHLSLLREHLGPMLLQFPYFRKDSGVDVRELIRRLDPFLGQHRELEAAKSRVVVEVRNKAFLVDELFALLARHDVALATIDHPWMPDPEVMAARMNEPGWRPAGFTYLRLLGDRKGIERVTKKWNREVLDQSWRVGIWVRWMQAMRQEGDVFVFVNNHYAGHAPRTVQQIEQALARG